MQLDIRTLTFTLLLFALVFAVGMYFVQRSQPGVRGLRWWAAANAVGGVGFMLLSLRGAIPDFLSIVAANSLLLAALFCFHEGLARFLDRPNRMPWLGPLLVTILALLLFRYAYILPSIATRIVVVTLLTSIPAVMAARLLIPDVPPKLRSSYWFTASAFVQFAVFSLGRAAFTLASPPADLMNAGPVHTLYFLSIFFLLVVATFGSVWMTTVFLADKLERQARTDPLTGAMNRLALTENIAREISRARRGDRPLSLLMFDLDHFKQLNDRLGHQAGDEALRAVSGLTHHELRASDILARYGGEEFVAVLPDTDKARAVETAERLRRRLEALKIANGDGTALTASYGVSTFPLDGTDLESLIGRADAMLYAAKQAGRNCVMAESA
ncbi:MAG: GGDEF domain-containing protein [Rhodocyclales bacterium]|nr:GGDEF domain-containing protein [Rhodocyclales bacterium]